MICERYERSRHDSSCAAGASVDIKRVPETVPTGVVRNAGFKLDQPIASIGDLEGFDAIVIGTGTRFGRMSSQMAAFSTRPVWDFRTATWGRWAWTRSSVARRTVRPRWRERMVLASRVRSTWQARATKARSLQAKRRREIVRLNCGVQMIDPSVVVVMARWKASEVNRAAVLELWTALRAQSVVEPGCLGYEVFEQVGEPGALLLVERYRNQQAAAAHRNSTYYRELIERIRPLLDARSVELLGLRDP